MNDVALACFVIATTLIKNAFDWLVSTQKGLADII